MWDGLEACVSGVISDYRLGFPDEAILYQYKNRFRWILVLF
jgi:hypothetical protein